MSTALGRYWRLLLLVLLLAGAALAYHFTGLRAYFHGGPAFERIRAQAQAFGVPGMAAFAAVYIAFVSFGLPNLPFQLAAGAIYGVWAAFLLMYVGVNIGALGAFTLARGLGRRAIEQLWGSRLRALNLSIQGGGFRFVLILRLIPLMPFNAINFAAGLSRIRIRQYVLANLVGMIPLTFVHVSLGHAAGELDLTSWSALRAHIGNPHVYGPLLLSAVLLVTAAISAKVIQTKRAKAEAGRR